MAVPVTADAGKPAKFQKTMESDSDEELDSEDLDESDESDGGSGLCLLFLCT